MATKEQRGKRAASAAGRVLRNPKSSRDKESLKKGPVEIAPGITVDRAVRFGKPVIKGTRVDVATLLANLAAGDSVDEVAEAYQLTRDQVLVALAYAAEIVATEEVIPLA